MEELWEVGLLLDFYGQLITKRQFEILDLHYNNDYSLGEIAQQMNISRQGVYDNIKRGKSALLELEEKLGLMGRFSEHKCRAKSVLDMLESISDVKLDETDRVALKNAKLIIAEIMED